MVVIEGGTNAIEYVQKSLEHGIPVVICAGTGRAADVITYACSRKNANEDSELMRSELERKIVDAFKLNEANEKSKMVQEKVEKCCEKAELITIFDVTKQVDLQKSILTALLNAHSSSPIMDEAERESQRLKQLRLALAWNRVDIAQEKIFREDVQWTSGSLDTIMTEAIRDDNAEFARLLMQQGVIMKDYLTEERLEELYKMSPNQKLMEPVFFKLIGKISPSINDLPKLLNELLDKYKWGFSDGRFIRPYKELFIWALLYGRQVLAKLCWEMGEEPVTSAIAATKIYDSLSHQCTRHESQLKKKFNDYKREFENLAISVLDACNNEDPDMAMILVERKSPSWDSITCMELAASANDQKFMSTAASQNSIKTLWRSGIQSHLLWVILATLPPPLSMLFAYCLEVVGASDDTVKPCDKLWLEKYIEKYFIFLSSPIYKFCNSIFWYLTFTILFTYFILVDFKAHEITANEVVCMVMICTSIVDEVVYMILLKKIRKWCDIRKWYGILKILDLLNFILAVIGFVIHCTFPEDFMMVKAIYSVNCVIFYVRFTKYFIANARLGPKLVMIKRMMNKLLLFLLVLVIFLMAYGVARQSMLYTQRNTDWDILKDIFYYPYWQLFGDLYLEESTQTDDACIRSYLHATNTTGGITPCQTSHWLVPVLLVCYLLVGQLLLINLLIAIFSHVFKTVEQNSQEIWKFQMYFLSMEYRKKTPFSPPLNIIIHIYFILEWASRRAIKRIKGKGTQTVKSLDEVYNKMSLENLQLYEVVIADEDIKQYLQLLEKEMMVNILNQRYIKMESMESRVKYLEES